MGWPHIHLQCASIFKTDEEGTRLVSLTSKRVVQQSLGRHGCIRPRNTGPEEQKLAGAELAQPLEAELGKHQQLHLGREKKFST